MYKIAQSPQGKAAAYTPHIEDVEYFVNKGWKAYELIEEKHTLNGTPIITKKWRRVTAKTFSKYGTIILKEGQLIDIRIEGFWTVTNKHRIGVIGFDYKGKPRVEFPSGEIIELEYLSLFKLL